MLGWVDEELTLLAFITKQSKTDLLNRIVADGLQKAWEENNRGETPHVVTETMRSQNGISEAAKTALKNHNEKVDA
jgi:hypothetical protein